LDFYVGVCGLKASKLSRETMVLVHTKNQIASAGICKRRDVCQEFLLVTIAVPWQLPFVVNGPALTHFIGYESQKIILGNCFQRLLDHFVICSVDPQYTIIAIKRASPRFLISDQKEKAHDRVWEVRERERA
jgi:hypothetical protein